MNSSHKDLLSIILTHQADPCLKLSHILLLQLKTLFPSLFAWQVTSSLLGLHFEVMSESPSFTIQSEVLSSFLERICFFLVALSLCCCVWAFSSCSKQGLLILEVHGLPTAVASLVAEHRLQAHRLQERWCRMLSHSAACGFSRARDWTCVPCTHRQIPTHL